MSNLFNLNWKDVVKSLLVAFLTAVLTGIYTGIEAGTFEFTWVFLKPIVLSSLGATVAYLIKNFLSNGNGEVLKK